MRAREGAIKVLESDIAKKLRKRERERGRERGSELAKVKSLTSKAVPPDHRLLISFMGGWINRLLLFNRAAAKMQVIYFIAAFPSLSSFPLSLLSATRRARGVLYKARDETDNRMLALQAPETDRFGC